MVDKAIHGPLPRALNSQVVRVKISYSLCLLWAGATFCSVATAYMKSRSEVSKTTCVACNMLVTLHAIDARLMLAAALDPVRLAA
jgi:hypothetical protein